MTTTRTVKIPDGKGGWKEIEGELLPGARADVEKQEKARQQQFIAEAAGLTERLLKFDRMYVAEQGLTKEHRAFAAALYCINLRETYPDAAGKKPDPEAFDVIAKMAADYYDSETKKG